MIRLRLFCAVLAAVPTALAGQTLSIPLGNSSIVPPVSPPTTAPTPAPTPFPSPVFTPPPVAAPVPRATPSAAPTEAAPTLEPGPASNADTARDTATRRDTRPGPTPTPSPDAAAAIAPMPAPSAAAAPTPASPIETVVLPQHARDAVPVWLWFAGAALLLLALAALLLRRRGAGDEEGEDIEALAPEPTLPAAAHLAVELRPTRAGVNLLTATVEAEVIVTNTGGSSATDIRTAVTLLGAGAMADAALDMLAAQPVGQPAVSPFALEPGAERRFRAVAALALDAIEPLSVAGRPMFVPLVGVTVQWSDGEELHRVTRGFAVGVERVDSAKLAPLWLDIPPRSYDAVAARPHGEVRKTS